MEINQFYTMTERCALAAGNTSITVDGLKLSIAERHDPEEWDNRYFVATRIKDALIYLTTRVKDNHKINWWVPRSPSRLHEANGEIKRLAYLATSKEDDRRLEFITERPRREITDAFIALGAGKEELFKEHGFTELSFSTRVDRNHNYICLTWTHKDKPNQQNRIFVHRGAQR